MLTNPILVQTQRGELIENIHRGSYVVMNADGEIIAAAGHFRRMIYAHSALKPLQAVAVVENDSKGAFLTDARISLACASHTGEESACAVARQWLETLQLHPDTLECGVHYPFDATTKKQMRERGETPSPLHNTCSGKHLAVISLAQLLELPIANYTQPSHPVHEVMNKIISEMTGREMKQAPTGIDGCQMPLWGMELKELALGMAKLVDPKNFSEERQKACRRVIHAMQTYPHFISGAQGFCSTILHHTNGEVLVKMGADGVFSAASTKRKVGIALKIDDGHLKAAQVALTALLVKLEILPQKDIFTDYLRLPLHNWNKQVVGFVEAVS